MAGLTRFLSNTVLLNGSGTAFTDTGSGTVIVDANAYVMSTGNSGRGISLTTGSWGITVNGGIFTDGGEGIYLLDTAASSTVTVGRTGEIFGSASSPIDASGVASNHSLSIKNSGSIIADHTGAGTAIGVALNGDGTLIVNNAATGLISAESALASYGIFAAGDGNHTITNAGTIRGFDQSLIFSSAISVDVVKNSGVLDGAVRLAGGDDTFTNFITSNRVTRHGTASGVIDMGDGNDRFFGGKNAELIIDTNGADVFKLGGGNDELRFLGVASDLDDTFDGGTGIDTIDYSTAFGSVIINLDSVAHTDLLSATTQVARKMTGMGTTADNVSNFETVLGNAQNDVIFGNGVANFVSGADGADIIYGFGGNDSIYGGNGADRIYGGAGKDLLDAGFSDGTADTFYYTALTDSGVTVATRDVISTFEVGIDQIDLSAIDAIRGGINDNFFFVGMNTAFGAAGDLRAIWTATQTIIEGDVTGDGRADFSIALQGNLTLTGTDFVL